MSPLVTSLAFPLLLPVLLLLVAAPLGGATVAAETAVCRGSSCVDAAVDEESSAMMQLKAQPAHAVSAKAGGAFNYSGFQIGDWPMVDVPDNLCDGSGKGFQSPINIQVEGADYKQMPAGSWPTFYAKDGGCSEAYFVDKGTTWQVDVYDPKNPAGVNCSNLEMEWNGKVYVMIQFHFHTLSEDTLDFKPFPMQMHMVHVASDNSIAVVGVLVDTHGPARKQNHFLNGIFETGFESDRKVSSPGNAAFNPYKALLSKRGEFWHYPGSLTTPPCTDGLDFFIAKDAVSISATHVTSLMDHLMANGKGNSYGQNHRPIQALNGREITVGRWHEVCPLEVAVPNFGSLDPEFCHWVEENA